MAITEAERLRLQQQALLKKPIKQRIPTALVQKREIQKRVDDIIGKIERGEITSKEQIPQDLREYIEIPEDYFKYKTEQSEWDRRISEVQENIIRTKSQLKRNPDDRAAAKKLTRQSSRLKQYSRAKKAGWDYSQGTKYIESGIQRSTISAARQTGREQLRRKAIGELRSAGTKITPISIEQKSTELLRGRAGIKMKDLPDAQLPSRQELSRQELSMYDSEKQTYENLGYSSKDAAILAREGMRQQVTFLPRGAAQVLKREERRGGIPPTKYVSYLKDAPKQAPSGVISEAKDPTFKEAFSTIITTAKYKGIGEAIKTTPLLYASIFKPLKTEKRKEEELKKRVEEARTQVVYDDRPYTSKDEYSIRPRAFGETSDIQFVQTEEKTLKRNTELGDIPSQIALTQMKEEEIKNEATQLALDEKPIKQEKYNKGINIIQKNVNEGKITWQKGNQQAQTLAEKLDEESLERIKNKLDSKIKRTQEDLDKIAKKGKISRIVLTTAAALVTGYAVGGILATAPRMIQMGVAGVAGTGIAIEGATLSKELIRGEAGTLDVVGFGANIAAFTVGAKIGARGRTPSANLKLEKALREADIFSKSKGIITEAELSVLEIPPEAIIELKGRIKGQASMKKIELEIRARDTKAQELIKKELPYQKIEFIEITDQLGKVVDRVALGKIEVKGKKGKTFKEEIIAESKGYVEEGVIKYETLTQIVEKGKVKEAILTEEIATGQLKKIAKGIKVGKGQVEVKLIEKIIAEGKKPLTQAQIKNLLLSEKVGKPISQSEFLEIQRRAAMKIKGYRIEDKAILAAEERLLARGVGISAQVLEVPVIKKYPKTPFKTTFKEEFKMGAEQRNILKKTKKRTDQVIKNMQKSISEKFKPPVSVEEGVRSSLQRATKQVAKVRQEIIPVQIPFVDVLGIQKKLQKQQDQRYQQPQLLTPLEIQNIMQRQDQFQGLNLMQLQKQQQLQQQQLQQQLQPQQLQMPKIKTPKIKIPYAPFDFEKKITPSFKKIQKGIKKQQRREAAYTASLSEAAFGGKPLELTKEQLKKLSQIKYTGLELRPVVALKPSKKRKRKKSKK